MVNEPSVFESLKFYCICIAGGDGSLILIFIVFFIRKTSLFKYTENFTTKKMKIFIKKFRAQLFKTNDVVS